MNDQIVELAEHFDTSRPEMAADPHRPFEVLDAMRQSFPVKRVERQPRMAGGDGPGWVLTRFDDVTEVFRDDEHFSSIGILGPSDDDHIPLEHIALEEVDPRVMARMAQRIPMLLDPPELTGYRRMMTPLLSPRRVTERERDTRVLVNRLIDDFIETGECDFHEQLDKPLPGVLTCQLLGLPTERWRSFADPIDDFIHREDAGPMAMAPTREYEDSGFARMQVPGMMAMLQVAQQRRQEPRQDMISELANSEIDGRALSVYELGAILSILLSGGTETTTSALGSAFVYLGRNHDVRSRLASDPTLIPGFAEEVLRMWPPIMTFQRIVKATRSIGGQEVTPGEVMYLSLAGANRDPEQFDDPHAFQYDRHPNRHVTFTVGIHRCLGSTLARSELRIAIEEVLRRIPDYELREGDVRLLPHFPAAFGYRKVGATFTPGTREVA